MMRFIQDRELYKAFRFAQKLLEEGIDREEAIERASEYYSIAEFKLEDLFEEYESEQ